MSTKISPNNGGDGFNSIATERKERIVTDLLAWYNMHKRDLPWRGASPYAVWISEIMLQQTQVVTVIPFFLRFMERFPTIQALANAPIEEVLRHWAGLGYYARARNLHAAAQLVVSRYEGKIPDNLDTIQTLPGIGRYTAGAILSIAYNQPRPLVDGNVIRVLSRLFGIKGDPKSATNQTTLWSLATQLVETASATPGDFNQSLMELGALICEPNEPKCDRCPLLRDCVAGNSPDPSSLPELPPNKTTVAVTHSSAILRNANGEVLIVQRPLHGLWGGLWEFPRVVCSPGETPQQGAVRAVRELLGMEAHITRRVATLKHAVTHHRITLYAFEVVTEVVIEPEIELETEVKTEVEISDESADETTKQEADSKQTEYSENGSNGAVQKEAGIEYRVEHLTEASGSDTKSTQQKYLAMAARWASPDTLENYAFSSPQALLREALLENQILEDQLEDQKVKPGRNPKSRKHPDSQSNSQPSLFNLE